MDAPNQSNHQDDAPQAGNAPGPVYALQAPTHPNQREIHISSPYPNILNYLSAGDIADLLEDFELQRESLRSQSESDLEDFPDGPGEGTNAPAGSAYAVSEWERNTYYKGVSGQGESPDPKLLYRTGVDRYPWVEPTAEGTTKTKSVQEVVDTPLNKIWDTVGPQVKELVQDKVGSGYSIGTVRFATRGEDGESTLGPVVIWIKVPSGSTEPEVAHEVSQSILLLLGRNGIEDVEVEWYEGEGEGAGAGVGAGEEHRV